MIDQRIVRMLHPQTRCHQPPQTEHCIRPSHSSKLDVFGPMDKKWCGENLPEPFHPPL
ncbi:hypothetical protein NQZ68_007412 [Dissostichus eleginoides]|nr:hypothetical protein NQZ68_007412 [Dissostichus eleginoides]